MTRALWATFLTIATFVVIALAIALGVGAPHPAIFERLAAGAFGLIGLGAGLISLSSAVDTTTSRRGSRQLDDDLEDAGFAALVSLERSLRFGESSAGDFYAQVRPRLIRITSARLSRKGIVLSDRERAAALLGEDAYALVDPETDPPADRFQPGVSLERVRNLLIRLEILGDLP